MTFQFTSIDIHKGAWEGDPTPRWFLIGHINDGSEIVMDMKLSQDDALTEALTYDVPITDHTAH